MTVYCIGVLEPLPAGWEPGSPEEPPVQECSVEGLTSRWNDDFESGNPLATSYIDISWCETAAGVGVGGGWGVDPFDTAPHQYESRFVRDVGSQTGQGFAAEITTDRAAYAGSSYGFFILEVRMGSGYVVTLYQGLYDPAGEYTDDQTALTLYYQHVGGAGDDYGGAATGVLGHGSFQTIRMVGEWSTWTGASCNADGWIDVCVDGVRVIHATGLQLATPAGESSHGSNEWNRIAFGPMGHGDNVHIWSD